MKMIEFLGGGGIPIRPEILLQPNIVKPLHETNPRTIKGDAWWDSTRKAAYGSTQFHCLACGVYKGVAKYHQWLEAHELYDIDVDNCRYTFVEVVPLCHSCHSFIHSGRLHLLAQKGEIDWSKFRDIMHHGKRLLTMENLNKMDYLMALCGGVREKFFPELYGTWGEWRLVMDGVEYTGKFADYGEWRRHFGRED